MKWMLLLAALLLPSAALAEKEAAAPVDTVETSKPPSILSSEFSEETSNIPENKVWNIIQFLSDAGQEEVKPTIKYDDDKLFDVPSKQDMQVRENVEKTAVGVPVARVAPEVEIEVVTMKMKVPHDADTLSTGQQQVLQQIAAILKSGSQPEVHSITDVNDLYSSTTENWAKDLPIMDHLERDLTGGVTSTADVKKIRAKRIRLRDGQADVPAMVTQYASSPEPGAVQPKRIKVSEVIAGKKIERNGGIIMVKDVPKPIPVFKPKPPKQQDER